MIWRSHALYLIDQIIHILAAQGRHVVPTGPIRRAVDKIERIDLLLDTGTDPAPDWRSFLETLPDMAKLFPEKRLALRRDGTIVKFYSSPSALLGYAQIAHTGPSSFVETLRARPGWDSPPAATEEAAFAQVKLPLIPPYLRNRFHIIEHVEKNGLPCLASIP